MLMHAQDPIILGTGEVVTFHGKYVTITDPEDGSDDGGNLTRADLTRLLTANHELAHALAAVSVGCTIHDMRITSKTGRAYRDGSLKGQLGHIQAPHLHTPEEAFTLLAGWAWEIRYGIPCRSAPDYEVAKDLLTHSETVRLYGDRWEEIKAKAGDFVERHREFIMDYAIELAEDIAREDGKLGKKPLRELNNRLRQYLGPEVRRRLSVQ